MAQANVNVLKEEIRNQIENRVNEVFQEMNYKFDEKPIDVIKIAKWFGFEIGNALLDDESDGFIVIEKGVNDIFDIETDMLIGVNSKRELAFKRFIIAHELGHYFLHCNGNEIYAHREHKKGKDKTENEADFFAACMLLPRELVVNKFEELKAKDLSINEINTLLMARFRTTEITTKRRLEELGLNV